MRLTIRFWFVLAVAAIAAACADPLIEAASNAGYFGAGNYTDHSTLDVLPAVLAGCVFVVLHLVLRVRAAVARGRAGEQSLLRATDGALSGSARLLPCIFGVQLLALYAMETVEQIAVFGHAVGGTLWLGGPAWASLLGHAAACVAVWYAARQTVRVLAQATLRALRVVRAIATLKAGLVTIAQRACRRAPFRLPQPPSCRIGERAPPLLPA